MQIEKNVDWMYAGQTTMFTCTEHSKTQHICFFASVKSGIKMYEYDKKQTKDDMILKAKFEECNSFLNI